MSRTVLCSDRSTEADLRRIHPPDRLWLQQDAAEQHDVVLADVDRYYCPDAIAWLAIR